MKILSKFSFFNVLAFGTHTLTIARGFVVSKVNDVSGLARGGDEECSLSGYVEDTARIKRKSGEDRTARSSYRK